MGSNIKNILGNFRECLLSLRNNKWIESMNKFNKVAIKIQNDNFSSKSFKLEADILMSLKGVNGIPQFIESNYHGEKIYLVSELLGKDLS